MDWKFLAANLDAVCVGITLFPFSWFTVRWDWDDGDGHTYVRIGPVAFDFVLPKPGGIYQ